MATAPPTTRKTRIVCISDTHNQTPKLPPGDVLIHAGDLTNQGSYSELRKVVEWIERADFEVKIVVAGNHDITLDEPFYRQHGSSWRWPTPQDPDACRNLLRNSNSITYLENESTTVRLSSPDGPGTTFTVFGSPYTVRRWTWAFQYDAQDAGAVWSKIPEGVDVVVTHMPPQGHCDQSTQDEGWSGCPALLRRLEEVRPMLSVCGHVHGGRGVERVRWRTTREDDSSLVEEVEYWADPGKGNKKLSLVDLTRRSGRRLGYAGGLRGCSRGVTRQSVCSDSLERGVGGQPDEEPLEARSGDEKLESTLSLTNVALCNGQSEALWGTMGSAVPWSSDIGRGRSSMDGLGKVPGTLGRRSETAVVNAAFVGPRVAGKAVGFNKPIVVDVELPVWQGEGRGGEGEDVG